MGKEKVRFQNLRVAMQHVQAERSAEVGGHTWHITVERYGLSFLFVEMASAFSRLEQMLWVDQTLNPYANPGDFKYDRAYDLLIDLGNYTDFLYQALQEFEKKNPPVSTQRPDEAR
jgi:hypothetical protein